MTFITTLAESPLPDLLQKLSGQAATGLLTVTPAWNPKRGQKPYYLWWQKGLVVAAADRLDGKGLRTVLHEHGWLSPQITHEFMTQRQMTRPIGAQLKEAGMLQPEQLRTVFQAQLQHYVYPLFALAEAEVEFEVKAPTYWQEMTGLSVSAIDLVLLGFRQLEDWHVWQAHLPAGRLALQAAHLDNHSKLRFEPTELSVLQFASGSVTLEAIAHQLKLSVDQVRQIAFRLVLSGHATIVEPEAEAPTTSQADQGDGAQPKLNHPFNQLPSVRSLRGLS